MTIKSWYSQSVKFFFSFGVIIFLILGLFFGGDFPIDGIRNISIAYITINTAILAVAFAATVIKQGMNTKSIFPKDYYSSVVMTTIGMFAGIYALYLSYVPIITMFTEKIIFAFATAITFSAVINMLFLMKEFEPRSSK
jgi:hypothetical protein